MAEAKFYTYVHRRADSGEVFYIGKGSGQRSHSPHKRSTHWTSIVAKHGFTVQIVSRHERESDAFKHEKVLIALHRAAQCRLANQTDGGEGGSGYKWDPIARLAVNEKIRQALANRSPEAKALTSAKMSAALKGKTFSAERRANQSLARMGKPLAESHRLALVGKVVTDAHRAALKAANARPGVKARRSAAISATMKGYVKSDEHRAALSAAAKADWARRKALAAK
jgi:hypothetical protein